MRLARRDDIVFPVTVRGTVVARRRALVVPGRHRRGFAPAAFVVFHLRPSLSGQPKDGQNQPVDHARADAVDDHRPRDREDLDRRARDEALCLCQDRTHIFLFFSNYRIQSNGNQLFLLKGLSSGLPCNCFYDFLGEIIMTPEVNLYSSIFIDTDLLYQFPKFFWAVPIQKLNTLGICF